MSIKNYSWGKASQNGKSRNSSGLDKPAKRSKSKAASAGVKRTKKIKTN
tara:strand:- start:6571 stop:6717 length:147 start_codon:yes stop_codon:yes gene_type:complete